MNPFGIHYEIMIQIKMPNTFSYKINPSKITEHITYWNGRGYYVVKGRPLGERSMMIKVRRSLLTT